MKKLLLSITNPFSHLRTIKTSLIDDYQITGFIGKGSTSRVFQGYHILSKQPVIIKLFKDIISEEKIKREIRINKLVAQCQHIVPLVDVIKDQGCGSYALIFANLQGVTLNHLIGKIGFSEGLKYSKQILQGLDFCHSLGVVHRDLKSSNILVTKNGAKIFDFGLGRQEKVDEFTTKRFGTKCYHTPQVIFKMPHFTNKCDIWTSGLIIAEMLSKKKPLMPYTSDEQTCRQIVQLGGYDEDIVQNQNFKYMQRFNFQKLFKDKVPSEILSTLSSTISKMLSINPINRPSAKQLLQEELFTTTFS